MMRVVLDSNLLVSAILSPEGKPARIVSRILDGEMTLILSNPILEEIARVFRYPKLLKLLKRHRVALKEVNTFLETLSRVAVFTPGQSNIDIIPEDPSDNIFLACAVEGQADFIISGDRHLTALKTFRGIEIMDPSTFLERII